MIVTRSGGSIVGFHFEDPVPQCPQLSHCGDEICGARHTIGRHRHDRFEFCYVSEGRALWNMGRCRIRQEAGQMLIAFPNQWHELASLPHGSYHILYAGVDLLRLGPQARQLAARLLAGRVQVVSRAQEAEPIMRGLVRQAAAEQPLRAAAVEALLHTLVVLIAQRLAAVEEGIDPQTEGPHSYPVQAALAYMRQQVHQRIAIEELAQVVNYSPAHFMRQFKSELGLSPARFHLRLRLQAAREELTQPGFSITSTAVRYGFSSSQHFSRAFHQMFGITPRHWQRQAATSRM